MGENLLDQLKRRASQFKAETFALYLAARHPETPWYAKLLVAGIIAYAFSPIDLIPDFIPILGYLDDLVLLPVCIALAIKMVPNSIMDECRKRARETFAPPTRFTTRELPVARQATHHIVRKGEIEMASIKGTRTEQNILMTFAGESQARNRYTYFAAAARKEGYVQIADIFEETANHEKEHAKRFFKFLEGGELEITASFPAGRIGSTAQNLQAAATGEEAEHAVEYRRFASIAREEGFPEIAAVWDAVRVAERQHEKRFRALLANLENGRVFSREEVVTWRCRNCGYLHEGAEAVEVCPACAHPRAHFELLAENY